MWDDPTIAFLLFSTLSVWMGVRQIRLVMKDRAPVQNVLWGITMTGAGICSYFGAIANAFTGDLSDSTDGNLLWGIMVIALGMCGLIFAIKAAFKA